MRSYGRLAAVATPALDGMRASYEALSLASARAPTDDAQMQAIVRRAVWQARGSRDVCIEPRHVLAVLGAGTGTSAGAPPGVN